MRDEDKDRRKIHSRIITLPNGEPIEVFNTVYLAESIGRTSRCVRQWEISGVLPETCFRIKVARHIGARYYSQEQVDAVVKCAEEAKISNGKPISRTTFQKRCYAMFMELQKKYLGE